jgi:hypothetical protein
MSELESKNFQEDVLFLEKIFESKYGSPAMVQKYDAAAISCNTQSIFWVQKIHHSVAAVGLLFEVYDGDYTNRPAARNSGSRE